MKLHIPHKTFFGSYSEDGFLQSTVLSSVSPEAIFPKHKFNILFCLVSHACVIRECLFYKHLMKFTLYIQSLIVVHWYVCVVGLSISVFKN